MKVRKKEYQILLVGITMISVVFILTFFRPALDTISWKSLFHKTTGPVKIINESGQPDIIDAETSLPIISAEDLRSKILFSELVTLIDIRDKTNFRREHIIDSININATDLKDNIDRLPSEKDSFIVIVGFGSDQEDIRSVITSLEEIGYSDVKNLANGITGWKLKYYQVVTEGYPMSYEDQSKVTFISPEEVLAKINEKLPLVILDVSDVATFSSTHIPGAINIPLDELERRRSEISKILEIVVYGKTDVLAFQGVVRLSDMGFRAAKILDGTPADWGELGYRLYQTK